MQFLQVAFETLRVVLPLALARQKVKPNLGATRWILNLVCMAGLGNVGHGKFLSGSVGKAHPVMVRREALGIGFDVALHLPQEVDCVVMVDHFCNVLRLYLAIRLDPSGIVGALVEVAFDVVKLAGSRFVGFSVHGVDSSKLEGGCKRENRKIVWHTSWVT